MNKVLQIFGVLIIILSLVSCKSTDDNRISLLFNELDISLNRNDSTKYVIIIPMNGCKECIIQALSEIHVSTDTVYILECKSSKDFYLSTGKKLSNFSNIYLDKEGKAAQLSLVNASPMTYILKNGLYVSKSPYISTKDVSHVAITNVKFDKSFTDLGKFDWNEKKQCEFELINIGSTDLVITKIESSCECTNAEISKQIVPSGETAILKVFFKAESQGKFERYVIIYCNVKDFPIIFSIIGDAQ